MSLGYSYIAACLAEPSTYTFLSHGDSTHLFKANELPIYTYVKGYVKKYGKLPTIETVELHTKDELPAANDAPGYYYDQLLNRYTAGECKFVMQEANKLLQPSINDPNKALELLTSGIMKLVSRRFDNQIVDFRDAYDIVFGDYVKTQQGDDHKRFYTGWNFVDEMSGGLMIGDLLSIVGRPAAGKSWFLLYMALAGWLDQFDQDGKMVTAGQSRLFISMEMKPLPILQRLSAIQLSMPYTDIDKSALSSKGVKKLKDGLTELKNFSAPFWVVDGNLAATVEDIYLLARQLKPDAILIDGGYLVKHPTERDRFRRVAENAELMKSELSQIAPTSVSWQFARSKEKKPKKGEGPEKKDLDDIGYTDAIGQVSSLVIGLLQKESIETVIKRILDILKGRKGETGQFETHWDFDKMNFGQYTETAVQDLSFV